MQNDRRYRSLRKQAQDIAPPGWDPETGYGVVSRDATERARCL
jgi:hypothetical protein